MAPWGKLHTQDEPSLTVRARCATVRRLYACCARRPSEGWPGQSRLCTGRLHAERGLHLGGRSE